MKLSKKVQELRIGRMDSEVDSASVRKRELGPHGLEWSAAAVTITEGPGIGFQVKLVHRTPAIFLLKPAVMRSYNSM